jgi:hypothetical protein
MSMKQVSSPTAKAVVRPWLAASALATVVLAGCGGGGGGGGESAIAPFTLYGWVAVGDLNGDGLPDVAATRTTIAGAPPHAGAVAIHLQDPARPGSFLPPNVQAVGNDPEAIVIGDLDGDGRADVVTANAILSADGAGASTVSVLRQHPSRPGEFLPVVNDATGTNPVSVAIGDLNGDGRPDLAVADSLGVSLLFQDPAARGSFLPRVAVGAPANAVAVADVDGDGRVDLVVTDPTAVRVLRQSPTVAGSFLPATSYAAGEQPIAVAIADLDRDGRPDLVVANLGSPTDAQTSSVSVLRQDPSAPGRFLAAVDHRSSGLLRARAVAIADLDRDGYPDIVVTHSGVLAGLCPPDCGSSATGVSVLRQSPAAPGQFLPASTYPGSDYTYGIAVADLNGDGWPDLAIGQGDGVRLRFQDLAQPGRFQAAVPLAD